MKAENEGNECVLSGRTESSAMRLYILGRYPKPHRLVQCSRTSGRKVKKKQTSELLAPLSDKVHVRIRPEYVGLPCSYLTLVSKG